MFRQLLCAIAICCFGNAASAAVPELVMVAPADQMMPLAQFQHDALVGGILKDLGDLLAARLGRQPRYLVVPGDKVGAALQQGRADGVCYVLPFWIDGDFDWTQPFLPDEELVASREDAPPVRVITDLRDKPVGTIASYRYPRIAQVLGARFVREDAASMDMNMRRMQSGRVQYTIIGRLTLAYRLHVNQPPKLRADLVFSSFKAQCAFAHSAPAPFKEINGIINKLVDDGTVDQILSRYR
jgi:polar amino acid transport system substrate-binding protein